MKEVLEQYAQPYHPARPTVCLDDKSVPVLADSRPGRPLQPGHARRQAYEYGRRGTRHVFIWVEPKAGWRHVLVTRRRTKEDLAKALRYRVDTVYPDAPVIDLVWDNLNTHAADALSEIFGKAEADRPLARWVFHPTPLHACWLNMAEIDPNVMTGQCLDRRIPNEWTLALELIAWETRRHQLHRPIAWSLDWIRAKRMFDERQRHDSPDAATMQN